MKVLRNIFAVIAALVGGSVINMGILELGPSIIPTPEGFDNTNIEALASTIPLLEPINYITIFLAHGLGTMAGAFIASKLSTTKKEIFALGVGGWFLLGGISMVFVVPSPTWYTILDLVGAYIPMAWIGWKLAGVK